MAAWSVAFVLLPAAFAAAPIAAAVDECTFDQAGVASELHRIASRRPGAISLPHRSAVEWREPSGSIVRLSYGGCVDLGVLIELEASGDAAQPPSVQALLQAVERYWSAGTARVVRRELQDGRIAPRVEDGTTVMDVDANEEFPFGATIRIGPGRASISWTAG